MNKINNNTMPGWRKRRKLKKESERNIGRAIASNYIKSPIEKSPNPRFSKKFMKKM